MTTMTHDICGMEAAGHGKSERAQGETLIPELISTLLNEFCTYPQIIGFLMGPSSA